MLRRAVEVGGEAEGRGAGSDEELPGWPVLAALELVDGLEGLKGADAERWGHGMWV